jgi:hypothetical protein
VPVDAELASVVDAAAAAGAAVEAALAAGTRDAAGIRDAPATASAARKGLMWAIITLLTISVKIRQVIT